MRDFIPLTSMKGIEEFTHSGDLAFLYVSRPDCSVCHALLPQVQHLMKKYPKIQLGHVDAQVVPEIAGRFTIFTVPVLLLFVDGKEYLREARIVHMDLLEEKLDKIYEKVVGLI